jgi:hypothetical protein
MQARDTASVATTAGREARCASGSVRPASMIRFCRQAMMEAVSACSEMRKPCLAMISKPSSMAPVEGEGRLPKVLPMKHLKAATPALDQRFELVDVVLGSSP